MKKEMKNPIEDKKKDKFGDDSDRLNRGGCFSIKGRYMQLIYRHDRYSPSFYDNDVGFRIVRNQK